MYLIRKYQNSGKINLRKYFREARNGEAKGYYYGTKSNKPYTAQLAAKWLVDNKIGNYNANSFSTEYSRQNRPLSNSNNAFGLATKGFLEDMFTTQGEAGAFKVLPHVLWYYMGKNMLKAYNGEFPEQLVSLQISLPQNTGFLWNDKYWAHIGNEHKGLNYNEYMDLFNKWFDSLNFSLNKNQRAYVANKNWQTYVNKGYNKKPNTNNGSPSQQTIPQTSTPVVTTPQATTSPEAPTQQTNEFTPQEGMTYRYENGQYVLVPETPQEQTPPPSTNGQPSNTLESLMKSNTMSIKNGINSGYWRRLFRKRFNDAVENGDVYGLNENGTLVFTANIPGFENVQDIINISGFDPEKGLTRRGMRLLKRSVKENNKVNRQNMFLNAIDFASKASNLNSPTILPTSPETTPSLGLSKGSFVLNNNGLFKFQTRDPFDISYLFNL